MSANGKPVKIHEFSAGTFLQPGEHILCAIIIGPDRDDPEHKILHMRTHAVAVEMLRLLTPETRKMILEHQERLIREFTAMVER
jgi:hypothetical protein